MSTSTVTLPTITKNSALVTQVTTILVRPQDQARIIGGLVAHTRSTDTGRAGLISLSLLHSLDGERILVYEQLDGSEEHSDAASRNFPERGLALAIDVHRYDVVYTNDRSQAGVTSIVEGGDFATFINVMHTTPGQQGALIDFVIANDDRIFTLHPGFRSANFHRSRDGERVLNYSHWTSEADFLDAINAVMGMPGLTMSRANELAATIAGARGWTDFRFYTVDAVVAR